MNLLPSLPAPQRTTGPRAVQKARQAQQGAASLIVVMVLFFIMALAGAYSSRNLVFEQRTSANQYRSTQALEAAEAGLEWAVSMLNGGRITANCREDGAAVTNTSFRQRYLRVDEKGWLTPAVRPTGGGPLWPSCVFNGADWVCSCPTDESPTMASPTGAGPFPAFRVRFTIMDPNDPLTRVITKPSVIMVESNGCTSRDEACLSFPGSAVTLEGRATVIAMVALKSAVPVPPAAALTVRNSLLGGTMQVVNTDPEQGGITVQAGGTVLSAGMDLRSVPGSGGVRLIENDEQLIALQTAVPPLNANRIFASVFGALPETYRQQPAATFPGTGACPPNCRQALSTLASKNPGRVIWVQGDVTLDTAGDIGAAPDPSNPAATGPVVIVSTGNLITTVGAGARIFGFVYTQGFIWTGSPQIQGAAFIESRLAPIATVGSGSVIFNRDVINYLKHHSGSFVRVPGGWRDYQ